MLLTIWCDERKAYSTSEVKTFGLYKHGGLGCEAFLKTAFKEKDTNMLEYYNNNSGRILAVLEYTYPHNKDSGVYFLMEEDDFFVYSDGEIIHEMSDLL